jgi:ethanolamine utilization cobalamin adenosyltransferase
MQGHCISIIQLNEIRTKKVEKSTVIVFSFVQRSFRITFEPRLYHMN